jgi:hypothetical protein
METPSPYIPKTKKKTRSTISPNPKARAGKPLQQFPAELTSKSAYTPPLI